MDTKKLRQKILDLAIRGKLVPQDPNDEPASVLLERIRAEKEQLIKEGKIKRSKKSAATDKSHYENVPFEIPENWVWCQFGEYLDVRDGTHDSPKYVDKGFPFVTSKNLNNGRIDFSTAKFISEEDHINFSQRSFVEDGDILFAMIGSIGNPVLVVKDREFSIKNVALFKPYNRENTYMDYVLYYLHYIQESLRLDAKGGMQPFIPLNYFRRDLMIPLPPLNEQKRIVSELQKLIAHIDEVDYEATGIKVDINKTKSKILELAISGKLVPQDPNDEPAIELLKRINPNFQPCDNSHYENIEFDIPQNWVWATIGDIFEHNTGKALNASNPNGTMLDYITTSNLYWDRFELSIIKQMPFTESEIERCIVRKGDLLICEGGDVGRAAIWDYDYNIMIQNHIHRLRGKVDICTRYFFYLFMHYKLHNLIGGKGVAIQGLSSRDLHNLIIPVPSLKEQYDIASSIDLYFSKLDMITAEL